MTEEEIYAAHKQASDDLRETLRVWHEQKREAEEEVARLNKNIAHLQKAVGEGKFYELDGVLDDHLVDVLCEVQPLPPSTLIDEVWE